jgi:hypothetical protein
MKYADKGERIDDLRLILERVAEVGAGCTAATLCSAHCSSQMRRYHRRALGDIWAGLRWGSDNRPSSCR